MTSYEVVSNFALYRSIESEFEVTFERAEPRQSFELRKMMLEGDSLDDGIERSSHFMARVGEKKIRELTSCESVLLFSPNSDKFT